MTKKSNSIISRSISRSNSTKSRSGLSDKISNLNRSSKRKRKPIQLDLSPIPENQPLLPLAPSAAVPEPVNELKVYKGKSKKVFTRNSWGVPIAYITSTLDKMKDTGITENHLKEELHYTKLLHQIFPFILDAQDITHNNRERVKEGQEFNNTSSVVGRVFSIFYGKKRIFIYKKEIVDHVDGNTPDILKFMTECIFAMANPESQLNFTYLDMKPENIGMKKGTRELVILDNGPDLCYVIPEEFIDYFKRAAIIVGVVRLTRPLTDDELLHLRTLGLTRNLIIAAFHKRLYNADEDKIIEKVVKYYKKNRMPLTAESMKTDLILPRTVINHYCEIKEHLGILHRRRRIKKIMKFTRLEQL